MSNDSYHFEQFMKRREEIARAYVCGDAAPLGEIVTRTSPATFFGPRGGSRHGADLVWSVYERDADSFESGGDSTPSRYCTWLQPMALATGPAFSGRSRA